MACDIWQVDASSVHGDNIYELFAFQEHHDFGTFCMTEPLTRSCMASKAMCGMLWGHPCGSKASLRPGCGPTKRTASGFYTSTDGPDCIPTTRTLLSQVLVVDLLLAKPIWVTLCVSGSLSAVYYG
jgi:hypothetical protein